MQVCPSQDLTLPMTSYFSGEGMNRGIVMALCVCVLLVACVYVYEDVYMTSLSRSGPDAANDELLFWRGNESRNRPSIGRVCVYA